MVGQIEIGDHADKRKQYTRNPGTGSDQPACLLLYRRRLIRGVHHVFADFAVLRFRADFINQNRARTLRNKSTRITIVPAPVILGRLRALMGHLPDAFGLAGEGGLLHAQVVAPDHNAVGRNFDAFIDQHQIPRHKIRAGDYGFPAVPDDLDMRRG
ncbi:hypothetical protein SDC9_71587 [bioreactor metagenome]|uniref:Uncharacterized protein n=1 Tax=bioreactor metagenome TaxID=1076179 RepID=A0A644YA81_9ZZZZ